MFRSKSAGILDAVATAIESESEGALRRRRWLAARAVGPERRIPFELMLGRETSYALALSMLYPRGLR